MSNIPPTPAHIANLQETLALIDGNQAVLQALLTTFIADVGKKRQQLEIALAQRDAVTLGELSHSIKSAAAVFSAAPTVEAALNVEMAWRNNDDAIFEIVSPLLDSLDGLTGYLKSFVTQ